MQSAAWILSLGLCLSVWALPAGASKPRQPPTPRTALDAWHGLNTNEKQRRRAVFALVEPDPGLPNVLIYGDSISIGYTLQVREILAGKANVHRIPFNGVDSGQFIANMDRVHRAMRDPSVAGRWDFEWDVIHFNVGLHDLKYMVDGRKLDKKNGKLVTEPEDYAKNLDAIARYLQANHPQTQIVFATTTPVPPEGDRGRHGGDVEKYNRVALETLAAYPRIRINDLYALVKPRAGELYSKPANVHFKREGSVLMAQQVAQSIEAALEAPKEPKP